MFTRSQRPTTTSSRQGAYTQLQQQDDYDEDYDDFVDQVSIARHPNSIIVASNRHSAIVPKLPQPAPLSSNGTGVSSEETATSGALAQDEEPTIAARASFSAKRAAQIPTATRQYIKSKLPFRRTMAAEASFATLPEVIMGDIQNGDLPAQTDPFLKELPKRGWTIVRRRRLRGRRKMLGNKKYGDEELARSSSLPFDKSLGQADHLSTSVFVKWEPQNDSQTMMNQPVASGPKNIPVSPEEFAAIVGSVRTAIENAGVQPTRISQGSSGSYFCRNSDGKIVGVFKPKNEEPYGRLNPKWTKWIHRHLFPCFFGRSCLIPNLGYISEAATSLIDRRLGTCIVPHTNVIHLASPSFHYDYLDRRSASVVGLPPKIGSFQCFLDGFKDASVFLREYPFPVDGHSSSSLRLVGRGSTMLGGCLGKSDDDDDDQDDELENSPEMSTVAFEERCESDRTRATSDTVSQPTKRHRFRWTRRMQDQFKLEFEQLVILDYLIRNTDRGLDNWMIKYTDGANNSNSSDGAESSGRSSPANGGGSNASRVSLVESLMKDRIQIAAIDNGLAFPFKHPDQWRSYPYGWLALPEPLIARPFSESTRRQFLGVLSDPLWWRETVQQLRDLFQTDADFDERMFQRQMAVLKGQGYNIVRALLDPSATPLDLVSSERVLVNQEEIMIEYDRDLIEKRGTNKPASPVQRVMSPRRLRTKRSTSFDLSMHREVDNNEDDAVVSSQLLPRQAGWKDRVKNRLSLDLGGERRRRRHNKRRLMKRLRIGLRRVGSDGENDESDSNTSSDEDDKRRRVTIIMETIEVVKSKPPYFTCC